MLVFSSTTQHLRFDYSNLTGTHNSPLIGARKTLCDVSMENRLRQERLRTVTHEKYQELREMNQMQFILHSFPYKVYFLSEDEVIL